MYEIKESTYPVGSYQNMTDTFYNIWYQWKIWQVAKIVEWHYISEEDYKNITGLTYPDVGPDKDYTADQVQKYLATQKK